jgi:hypothetical protein
MKYRIILLLCSVIIPVFLISCGTGVDTQDQTVLGTKKKRPVFYIGPTVGYNKSFHSVEMKSFVNDNKCPSFSNGNDNGFYVGANLLFPFQAKDSRHSINVKFLYSSLPSYFEVKTNDEYDANIVDDQGNQIPNLKTSTTNSLKIKYQVFSTELLYGFMPMPNMLLRIVAGPTIDFAISKKMAQKYELNGDSRARFKRDLNHPEYVYSNGDRLITIFDGDIKDASSLRFGFKFGGEIDIPAGKGVTVVPHAFYNLGLTKLVSGEDWRVNALQVGLDVRFTLNLPGFASVLGSSN